MHVWQRYLYTGVRVQQESSLRQVGPRRASRGEGRQTWEVYLEHSETEKGRNGMEEWNRPLCPEHGPRMCVPAHMHSVVQQRESRPQEASSETLRNLADIVEIMEVAERDLSSLCQRSHFPPSHIDLKPQGLLFISLCGSPNYVITLLLICPSWCLQTCPSVTFFALFLAHVPSIGPLLGPPESSPCPPVLSSSVFDKPTP